MARRPRAVPAAGAPIPPRGGSVAGTGPIRRISLRAVNVRAAVSCYTNRWLHSPRTRPLAGNGTGAEQAMITFKRLLAALLAALSGSILLGAALADTAAVRAISANFTLTVVKAGSGAGTVTSSVGAIDCGAVCSDTYAESTAIVLTATPDGASQFTGWLGPCTGAGTCSFTMGGTTSAMATFAPALPGAPNLDIDGNASNDALTDGLLALRYLFELSGPALIANAVGPGATRITDTQIHAYLTDIRPVLDIDGNGQADALTDGLLIIRYLFNLRGDGLVRDAVGSGAIRTTAEQIEARIQSLLAATPVYTLTVGKTGSGTGTVTSSPAGIDCGGDCSEDYSAGTLIQLTAAPGAGSTFGGWGGACAGTGPCTLTLSGNTLVTAAMVADPGALPTIASFSADPPTIGPGGSSLLAWSIADATSATIDHGVGSIGATGGSTSVSPGMTTTYTLTATNASGVRQAQATVKVNPPAPPVINSFTATPGTIGAGGNSTLSWSIANATSAAIDNGIGSVNAVSGSTGASPIATTTYTLMAANAGGTTFARATIANTAGAPPLNPTVATSVATSIAFLYSGPSPVQTGVAPGTIEVRRAAVVRGNVSDRAGTPLPGVTITILDHPEYGQTQSRADGMFDMAINGGGLLTVNYQKTNYLPVQRQRYVPWQDYVVLPDVVLIPLDAQVSTVNLGSGQMENARASVVTDGGGTRQATLLFPAGTPANIVMPGGGTQPVTTLHVRMTEYTVGSGGPNAMPAELPPVSAYTYAVEFSADEVAAAGGESLQLGSPVYSYLENFLGFPTGIHVPSGYYDRKTGSWVPSDDGRVIKILTITSGMADLDTDGDDTADNNPALGITAAERQQLAQFYNAGQSLWRVPISHFSAYDYNWGETMPGSTPPQMPPFQGGIDTQVDTADCAGGLGWIECQNQAFHERIGIVGSPFSLNYSSYRTPGYIGSRTIRIPLSGPTVPTYLKRIELEVSVAGRKDSFTFSNAPNQSHTYVWDGMDVYGRVVQGARQVTTTILYIYDHTYGWPADVPRSFMQMPIPTPGAINMPSGRVEVPIPQENKGTMHSWDARGLGLGGWSLNAHHTYDPTGRILYEGNGQWRGTGNLTEEVNTIAGTGTAGFSGDGGPAGLAQISNIDGMATGPDGSIYLADSNNRRIRKVSPLHVITTIAGDGTQCHSVFDPSYPACGDGGPATQAHLDFTNEIAVGRDGSLYLSDYGLNRIRRIGPDGVISTVAGSGAICFPQNAPCGDGGPATLAQISAGPIALGTDGSLYIAEYNRHIIRKVSPDGIIQTIAGTAGLSCFGLGNVCGDGGLASQATLGSPLNLVAAPDGSLYFRHCTEATYCMAIIRRIGPDGVVTTIAGNGQFGAPVEGGSALNSPVDYYGLGITMAPNGGLYFGTDYAVYRITSDGLIKRIAGQADNLGEDYGGDGGFPANAIFSDPHLFIVGADGGLYISDRYNYRIRKVNPLLPGLSDVAIALASQDASKLYNFDATGRHLSTVNALTGAVLLQFAYDTEGRLAQVTDASGNVTTIQRDGNGNPTAIVAPFGQHTTLSLDGAGFLAAATSPANETTQFGYGAGGLLTSLTTPKGDRYAFGYDAQGYLVGTLDAAGGTNALTRTEAAASHKVVQQTGLGHETSYQVDRLAAGTNRRLNTYPDATQTETQVGPDGGALVTTPDGETSASLLNPDPRFSVQAPYAASGTTKTPSDLTTAVATVREILATDPGAWLGVGSLQERTSINNHWYTSTFNAATRTFTNRTPTNRQATVVIDALGRVVQKSMPTMESVITTYDTRGRVSTVVAGTGPQARTTTYAYDAVTGFLKSVTDPLGRTWQYEQDLAGRTTRVILPDATEVLAAYDEAGNRIALTPPGKPQHAFSYSAVDLQASYTPPGGAGSTTTWYLYDSERKLTRTTRPDGTAIDMAYDSAGRLSAATMPGAGFSYAYSPASGLLSGITTLDGSVLAYGYDGSLLTTTGWSGPIAGAVGKTFNADRLMASISVNGQPVSFTYNADNLLTQAGAMALTRSAQTGLVTATHLGNVHDARGYNGFGEPATYSATFNAITLFAQTYTRDKAGRIASKAETIGGVTDTYEYTHDLTGRLTEVKKNGFTTAAYTYDGNGNRLTYTAGATINASHDSQDRLLAYGTTTYQHTANGERHARTAGGQTTVYTYDGRGNLRQVLLPDRQIDYVIDGENRRIGKKVNGALTKGFLYQGRYRIVAELDGSNNVVSRFVYGTGRSVPDYMIKAGVTYRIVADHLGSPRLVVTTVGAAPTIAQRIDYDEYGRVLQDTNPGFQPFGFAGGLHDPDTGLVRFGARDYDPEPGRWTAKDPVRFGGGQTNLYSYVANDPVNAVDVTGLGGGGNSQFSYDNDYLMALLHQQNQPGWMHASPELQAFWQNVHSNGPLQPWQSEAILNQLEQGVPISDIQVPFESHATQTINVAVPQMNPNNYSTTASGGLSMPFTSVPINVTSNAHYNMDTLMYQFGQAVQAQADADPFGERLQYACPGAFQTQLQLYGRR